MADTTHEFPPFLFTLHFPITVIHSFFLSEERISLHSFRPKAHSHLCSQSLSLPPRTFYLLQLLPLSRSLPLYLCTIFRLSLTSPSFTSHRLPAISFSLSFLSQQNIFNELQNYYLYFLTLELHEPISSLSYNTFAEVTNDIHLTRSLRHDAGSIYLGLAAAFGPVDPSILTEILGSVTTPPLFAASPNSLAGLFPLSLYLVLKSWCSQEYFPQPPSSLTPHTLPGGHHLGLRFQV